MTSVYNEFLVFDLENDGERKKLNIKQEELQNYLNPEQVLVIIREDIRRIYIWKGSKSPVRKRFISSRVARDLQKELLDDPRYHRCKIVSIDQGDELQEFLDAFKLESMEVTERLPDMRYIRNIERERLEQLEQITKGKTEELYYSPALQDTGEKVVISSLMGKEMISKPSAITRSLGLPKVEQQKIKEKILKIHIPENYKRQNLVLGHTLFAAVSKKAKVLDEEIEDIVWEPVKKVPKERMDLDDHKLRVYFNIEKGIVEAIEILKKKRANEKKSTIEKSMQEPSSQKSPSHKKKSSLTPMPPKPASMKKSSEETDSKEE